MAAPTYDAATFSIAANLIKSKFTDVSVFQGVTEPNGSPWNFPALPADVLTVGTGAGNFNCSTKSYVVTATGNTDYDLFGGTILDPFGNALTFDIIKYYLVANYATTANYWLDIDGTVANAWLAPFAGVATAKLRVAPGHTDGTTVWPGIALIGGGSAAGYAVNNTSKVVRLAAGSNTIPHRFYAIGVDT